MASKKKNPLVETVVPVESLEDVQPIEETTSVEDITPIEAAPTEAKPTRKTSAKEDVLARRGQIRSVYEEVITESTAPMTRVQIARAADAKLGRPGDGISWNDGGVAIAAFLKEGFIVETKKEGRKATFYTKPTQA
jgi:hypothetical protein